MSAPPSVANEPWPKLAEAMDIGDRGGNPNHTVLQPGELRRAKVMWRTLCILIVVGGRGSPNAINIQSVRLPLSRERTLGT